MFAMADLSWEEVENYLKHDDRVILPLGAVEEHGRHLGLGTDFLEANAIAAAAAEEAQVLTAPTLNYGQSMVQMGFPGTISLRSTTMIAVVEDLVRSLYQHGFRRILIVNGHGGNMIALACALYDITPSMPDLRVKYFEWWTDAECNAIVTETMGAQKGSHATAAETAFMMSIRPEAVKMERLTGKDAPIIPQKEMSTVHNFGKRFPDGIMGLNPANATAEAGGHILEKAVEICVKELREWPAA
jgi:creatinine amidohydrolase